MNTEELAAKFAADRRERLMPYVRWILGRCTPDEAEQEFDRLDAQPPAVLSWCGTTPEVELSLWHWLDSNTSHSPVLEQWFKLFECLRPDLCFDQRLVGLAQWLDGQWMSTDDGWSLLIHEDAAEDLDPGLRQRLEEDRLTDEDRQELEDLGFCRLEVKDYFGQQRGHCTFIEAGTNVDSFLDQPLTGVALQIDGQGYALFRRGLDLLGVEDSGDCHEYALLSQTDASIYCRESITSKDPNDGHYWVWAGAWAYHGGIGRGFTDLEDHDIQLVGGQGRCPLCGGQLAASTP